MIQKRISIPIFVGDLMLYQGVPFADISKKYETDELGGAEGMYIAVVTDKGFPMYVIAVHDEVTPEAIAHEAAHITHSIMAHRGMKPDIDNDEWECYLLGWIVKQCHKYFVIK